MSLSSSSVLVTILFWTLNLRTGIPAGSQNADHNNKTQSIMYLMWTNSLFFFWLDKTCSESFSPDLCVCVHTLLKLCPARPSVLAYLNKDAPCDYWLRHWGTMEKRKENNWKQIEKMENSADRTLTDCKCWQMISTSPVGALLWVLTFNVSVVFFFVVVCFVLSLDRFTVLAAWRLLHWDKQMTQNLTINLHHWPPTESKHLNKENFLHPVFVSNQIEKQNVV